MGTRWALHLSCTTAAMVVRRNKSWDQSACLPASTAALPKLCRAPLLLVFSFVIKLEKQYQTFWHFGFVNSWLLCYMFSIAVWPAPKLCQSSHKIFCGNPSSFQRSFLLSWSKDGIWPFLIRTDNGLNSFYGTWLCQRKNLVGTLEFVHKLDLTIKKLLLWLNNSCSIGINKAKIHRGKSYRTNFAFGWVLWRKGPNFRILP